MRSSKMAAGSGRAAIFHHHHNRDRKGRPKSWLTSFPASPSWNQDGGATSNVWRTLGLPWNPQKGLVLVKKRPVDVWLTEIKQKKSIWSLASPNHSRDGWGSCPLATTGKSISLHVSTPCPMGNCYPWDMVLASGSTYSTFFGFYVLYFLTVLYNSLELLYSTVS